MCVYVCLSFESGVGANESVGTITCRNYKSTTAGRIIFICVIYAYRCRAHIDIYHAMHNNAYVDEGGYK